MLIKNYFKQFKNLNNNRHKKIHTIVLKEGCKVSKNEAASTGSSGLARAAACLCCSRRCCVSTSSCNDGGNAAKNSGLTSLEPPATAWSLEDVPDKDILCCSRNSLCCSNT